MGIYRIGAELFKDRTPRAGMSGGFQRNLFMLNV